MLAFVPTNPLLPLTQPTSRPSTSPSPLRMAITTPPSRRPNQNPKAPPSSSAPHSETPIEHRPALVGALPLWAILQAAEAIRSTVTTIHANTSAARRRHKLQAAHSRLRDAEKAAETSTSTSTTPSSSPSPSATQQGHPPRSSSEKQSGDSSPAMNALQDAAKAIDVEVTSLQTALVAADQLAAHWQQEAHTAKHELSSHLAENQPATPLHDTLRHQHDALMRAQTRATAAERNTEQLRRQAADAVKALALTSLLAVTACAAAIHQVVAGGAGAW